MSQKPYLTDGNDKPIVAAQAIKISEITIATGTWTAIPVPAGISCKAVVIRDRNGVAFKLSDTAAGTVYITLTDPTAFDFVGDAGAVFGYVQASSGTGPLECLWTL